MGYHADLSRRGFSGRVCAFADDETSCKCATSSFETFALLRECALPRSQKCQETVVGALAECAPTSHSCTSPCSESLMGVLDRFSVAWSNGSNVLLSLWEEMGITDEVLAERLDSAYAHLNELMEKMVCCARATVHSYKLSLCRLSRRLNCATASSQRARNGGQASCSGERCWACQNSTSRCAYPGTLSSDILMMANSLQKTDDLALLQAEHMLRAEYKHLKVLAEESQKSRDELIGRDRVLCELVGIAMHEL